MRAKRIIPCLDVVSGRVVKGTNFVDLNDAGDPVELARRYDEAGADELVFLDITASQEGRKTMLDVVRRTAEQVSIPFIVGGGIGTLAAIEDTLSAGADKISINTAAVVQPELIQEAAVKFGSQRVVVAVDVKRKPAQADGTPQWEVYTHGGRIATGLDVVKWAQKVEELGAGEILLTSMDADGTQEGYDNELNRAVARSVEIPVIASGGAGKLEHLKDAVTIGEADAVLAASIFHFGQYTIREAKEFLRSAGIQVYL